ncbi:response regulator [Fulvivirgaceae bacterium PWU5]|uniref:Response regulator n=1 Tax=Dawidia cretensis TaxID=2782350 RepID=A0AAP2DVB4_9BACT|nr:response regulator [Dawidia cretensis]MBT1707901.1 response regulator [Dawidia cretensis]
MSDLQKDQPSQARKHEFINIAAPILLVDDDEDDHAIFKEICVDLGVGDWIHVFHTGFELIDFLKNESVSPFIILCDINMPRLDGLQLRALINQDERLRRKSIPFIFFSTSASESQVKLAYDLTVQGFFLKGNTYEETKKRFERILHYWSDCQHPNS